MTPLNYFTSHIWIHKQNGKTVEYEDKRTGDTFNTREAVNKHCREQAKKFETQTQLKQEEL